MYSKFHYETVCGTKGEAKLSYKNDSGKKRGACRSYYAKRATIIIKRARKYYTSNRTRLSAYRKQQYELAEPKSDSKHFYMGEVRKYLLSIAPLARIIKTFEKLHPNAAKKISRNNCRAVVSLIVGKRLVIKALQTCKDCADSLLKAGRAIKHLQITDNNDFGEDLHTLHSEPHFYDASYKQTDRKDPIPIIGVEDA